MIDSVFRHFNYYKKRFGLSYCALLPALILLLLPNGAMSQAPTSGHDPSYDTPRIGADSNAAALPPPLSPMERQRMQEAENAERHHSMVENAKKLVDLAQALDDEVGRSSPDAFTPAQLNQIGQIQKLARRVRSAMSSTARDSGTIQPAPILVPAPTTRP